MDDKEIAKLPKINCTTVITWRNTKTGEIYKDKKEGPDIVQDCSVQISPKGLEVLQKVMQKNDKSNK
tara:strand:+ start:274 stop:474 length:201 start_codon:yes stop_codon:yes gene_type:complete